MVRQEQLAVADAREADHRFANHLALLSGFVRFKSADLARQRFQPTVEGVQLILESLRGQIDAMARLHRSLADGAYGAPVDLAEQLHEICEPLSLVLGGRMALTEDVRPGCWLPPDRILPLTQIVAEVITNSVKHAYRLGQVGQIRVGGRQDPDGHLVIEIADDGPGLPQGFDADKDSGLGFHLIRALAIRLEAVVEFETRSDGLCFRLTLPAEPAI
ncbi:sensor histidine kinase [Phenylobacterium sp.]|uniref:sensor histidine kinase n=1 Tax=Phenylobacterium sp. TaxID=1871053 RepID=UPI0011FF4629|nr:sensor histidine kinase [Phenylobacterium sp.]THD54650.1 MAG: sensor histidine kinase [Phenylobacterium sp.]